MAIETAPAVAAPRTLRILTVAGVLWASLILIQFAISPAILDPDMFHEMALAREILATGRVPLHDSFAYTPTISPVIHHEWGMGMLLYFVATRAGMTGIYLLTLALAAGVVAVCIKVARMRGAVWPAIIVCAPIMGPLGIVAYGAVRAQFVTSLFMGAELLMLEQDRRGKYAWIVAWIPLYIAWVNLHGGFLVGPGVLALYWIERAIRTRRCQWRLLCILAATIALGGVSPYGYADLVSVIHGSLMARPLISEWQPLWTDPIRTAMFAVSLVPLLYALPKIGWRRALGLPLIAACALLCIRHDRFAGLYAIAWLCYVPGWFTATPASQWFAAAWRRHPTALLPLALLFLLLVAINGQYRLVMPVRPEQAMTLDVVYPVGPVAYLRRQRFHGNVMTPFEVGAFVSWELAPAVKVSIDGRFEVAYPPALLPEIVAFYRARPGWRQTLERYPTDLVLVRNSAPIAARLARQTAWQRVYMDDVYALYARPNLNLPVVNRTGQPLLPTFP